MYRRLLDSVEVAELSALLTSDVEKEKPEPRSRASSAVPHCGLGPYAEFNQSCSRKPPSHRSKLSANAVYNKYDYLSLDSSDERKESVVEGKVRDSREAPPHTTKRKEAVTRSSKNSQPRKRKVSATSGGWLLSHRSNRCRDFDEAEDCPSPRHKPSSSASVGRSGEQVCAWDGAHVLQKNGTQPLRSFMAPADDDLMDLLEHVSGATGRRTSARQKQGPVTASPLRAATTASPAAQRKAVTFGSPRRREANEELCDSLDIDRRDAQEILRAKCKAACSCYWRQFPELETPINPSSHAAKCPCLSFQEDYEALERGEAPRHLLEDGALHPQPEIADDAPVKKLYKDKLWAPIQSTSVPLRSAPRAVFGTAKRRTIFDSPVSMRSSSSSVCGEEDAKTPHTRRHRGQRAPMGRRHVRTPPKASSSGPQKSAVSGGGTSPSHSHAAQEMETTAITEDEDQGGEPMEEVCLGTKTVTTTVHPDSDATSTICKDAASDPEGPTRSTDKSKTPTQRRIRSTGNRRHRSSGRTPGPGAYDVAEAFAHSSASPRSPQPSMSTAKRIPEEKIRAPGPGAYNLVPPPPPIHKEDDLGRGPYGEAAVSVPTAPFLTSSLRNMQMGLLPATAMMKQAALVPGPGAYHSEKEPPSQHARASAYSFPKSEPKAAAAAGTEGGGPAAYNVLTGQEVGTGRAVSFLGATRLIADDRVADSIPGPGSYAVEEAERHVRPTAPAATIRFRHEVLKDDQHCTAVPGPGHYDSTSADGMDSRYRSEPQWTIRGQRLPGAVGDDGTGGEASPGPGEYLSMYPAEKPPGGFYMGSAPRGCGASTFAGGLGSSAPGPGTYDTDRTAEPPGGGVMASTAPRFAEDAAATEKNFLPGPGTYTPQYSLVEKRPVQAVLSTASPRFEVAGHAEQMMALPGPGAYAVDTTLTAPMPVGVVIGTAPRVTLPAECQTDFQVGPGAYTLPNLSTGPSFVLRSRPHEPPSDDVPGPGSYNILDGAGVGPQPPRVLLAMTSPRFQTTALNKEQTAFPGPGSYDPSGHGGGDANGGGGFTFGQASRHPSSPTAEERPQVGPGSYDVTAAGPTSSPNVVLGTARRFAEMGARSGEEVPGPGAYDILSPTPTHAVSFGTMPRPLHRKDANEGGAMPGPASYDPSIPQQVQNVVFGTSPARPAAEKDSGVGPGAYCPMEAGTAAAMYPLTTFSRADRYAEECGDDIGPGTYEVPDTLNPRAVIFGTASRGFDCDGPVPTAVDMAAETPGPGSYEVTVTRDGRAISHPAGTSGSVFGTAPRMTIEMDDARNCGPGPGAYIPQDNPSIRAAVFGTNPRAGGAGQHLSHDVPGPGAYAVQDAITHPQSPQYSFGVGGIEDDNTETTTIPGPGTYDAAVSGVTRAVGIGKAIRFPAAVNDEDSRVGPGHYNPKEDLLTARPRHAVIGTAQRVPTEGNAAGTEPGPGEYDPKACADGPHMTIPTATRFADGGPATTDGLQSVGPGAYDVQGAAKYTQPSMPIYSFGTSRRPVGDRDPAAEGQIPGPRHYTVPLMRSVGSQAHAFGTAPTGRGAPEGTSSVAVDTTPGPGSYDICLPKGPSVTIAPYRDASYTEREAEAVPGPGTYNVTNPTPHVSSPAVGAFAKARRFVDGHDEALPGPGAYDVHQQWVTGSSMPSFPTAPRDEVANREDLPGPGHYSLPPPESNANSSGVPLRYTAARFTAEDVNGSAAGPGPGEYGPLMEPIYTKPSGPSFTLAERFPDVASAGGAEVGPGSYEVTGGSYSSPSAFRFGTEKRFTTAVEDERGPGPGAYAVPQLSPGPAYTLDSRRPLLDNPPAADGPGPGAYDVRQGVIGYDAMRNAPVLRSRPALQDVHADNPGPGAYDVSQPFGHDAKAFSLVNKGSELRQAADGDSHYPGPGSYDTHNALQYLHGTGPAYSMVTRPAGGQLNQDGPGPGTYVLPEPHRGPAVGFGTGMRSTYVTEDTVGPGTYDLQDKSQSPAYSMGMRRPASAFDNGVPGPGAYHCVPPIYDSGVTFSQAPRDTPTTGAVSSVGPGDYQVLNFGGVPEGRAAGFGFGSRPNIRRDEPPGPGHYYNNDLAAFTAGPAATFGISERPSLSIPNGVPGPGSYEPHHSAAALQARGTYGPSFGIRSCPTAVLNDYPGPGSYHPLGEIPWPDSSTNAGAPRKARDDATTLAKLAKVGYPVVKKRSE